MLKFVSTLGALLFLTATAAQASGIGFRRVAIDADNPRPLSISLWYPTRDTAPSGPVGENRAFVGIPAITDAAPDHERHPLVVLSHGYGGSWRNLNWLAGELVEAGYVVAAPDHPGTTTSDRDPERAAMLWERPHDLSRTNLGEDMVVVGAGRIRSGLDVDGGNPGRGFGLGRIARRHHRGPGKQRQHHHVPRADDPGCMAAVAETEIQCDRQIDNFDNRSNAP